MECECDIAARRQGRMRYARARTKVERTWRVTGNHMGVANGARMGCGLWGVAVIVRDTFNMTTRGPMWGWELFFEELSSFLRSLNRQHGTANESFSHYALERIEIACGSLESVLYQLRTTVAESSLNSSESATVTEFKENIHYTESLLLLHLCQGMRCSRCSSAHA